MSSIELTLTPEQEIEAAKEGFARALHAIREQLVSRHSSASMWGSHIEGAGSELAVSLGLGEEWTGKGWRPVKNDHRVPPADVGGDIDVKWVAPSRREPTLNFGSHAPDDLRYVLVTGWMPTYRIVGWMRGWEARQTGERVRYPERTVYRVPASMLRPIERVAA